MPATALPTGGIALHGAPDFDITSKDTRNMPVQAMQLEITQDIVDELLESVRTGKVPQIVFGRAPQLKYGDKTHTLQTNPENYRYELYQSSGTGSDDDDLEFAGLINHSLAVQKAEDVTAGVDTALEQLKHSMAAISELKQANKTIVGDNNPMRTPGHRRFPSKGFKPQHLNSSTLGSPMLSVPSSPMRKAPTSQPSGNHDLIVRALRVPLIHLLAIQPSKDTSLADTCRTTLAIVREILPKIARRSQDDQEKWQLTDKSFGEINPWKFPYKSTEEREQAINGAVKSFDRLRLAKDDKLWQILLPVEERGQGKCLSRLNLKAVEPKPNAKPSTPLHKMTKQGEKKPAASKKAESKDSEKRPEKKVKESKAFTEPKLRKVVKEKASAPAPAPAPAVKDAPKSTNANARTPLTSTSTSTSSSSSSKPAAPPNRNTPATDSSKARTKKMASTADTASPRVKPKAPARDPPTRERTYKPPKPAIPLNTKPKNPSPLSASPPVNASDFEDNHPVHKVLSGSPVKPLSANSDRTLKRKANDIDSDIHNHNHGLAVKQPRVNRPTPTHTPSSTNGRMNGSTPSSASSLKRRSDDSSTSNTPATKIRKVTSIDTGLASRYPIQNSQASPGDSSSSTTSPSIPSLSFRQTVELSQKFQKYYKKYESLYWKLAESDSPPAEGQRKELLNMHKKLEEMKREIKAGAGIKR
ncbi:hypothetical protein B0J11DRAFT_422802 [Dendryphion nanum]|uniref:Uncharacterized protein n=1 Tax=Dendryphion nanum TaxID=256645 RepID=A0A9P9EJ20_9PLEO|nr:hypothetical protein B0J11DRAFT_422802 [Dendryphion nanum]